MNEQLRELVKSRLSDAVNCPAKDDIVEEITADLTAKYTDLLDCGLAPEEAFAKVESGIGDLSEVVSFINEANRRSEEASKTSNNPFAGLEDLMRQMGRNLKNLEPDLREVANDLKSAAGHITTAAKGLAQESKEHLKDMASSVKSGLKSTWKTLSESIDGNKHRYDYTVPATDITSVEVQTSGGDVTFGVSQDDNVYIVELSKTQLTEDKLARILTQDGLLTIAQGQKYSAGSLLFSYGMLSSDFEIYLPQRAWHTLKITTSSGDVELEKDLEVANLDIHTTSGDIEAPGVSAGVIHIQTVNGDLEFMGNCSVLELKTVNGDMNVNGGLERLTAESTNGDFRLKLSAMPQELSIHTVNGDTNLYLPDNDGFALKYQRVNGDVRSDFDLKTSLNDKSGIAVYLTGNNRQYNLTTVNGDLRIYRR